MTLKPPRRTYAEKSKGGLKDVDAAARAQRIKAWGWSIFAGIPTGLGVGTLVGRPLLGSFLGPVLIWAITMGIAGTTGKVAGALHMPSGSSTPRKKEYSRAEALAIRGDYPEAIQAFQEAAAADPLDPEPYLRIARIHRDQLKDAAEAVRWFRRASAEARPSPGQEIRTRREMAEVFLYTLREPRKAAPELARLAERYPDTRDGRWAAEELARIKEELAKETLGGR